MKSTFPRQICKPVPKEVESLAPEFLEKVDALSAIPKKTLHLLFNNCGNSIVSLYETVTDPEFRVDMLRGCGYKSVAVVSDFLRVFLARIEYIANETSISGSTSQVLNTLNRETVYTLNVEGVSRIDDNEVYEVSCNGIKTQVKKYKGQSGYKKVLQCTYIGNNVFGRPLLQQVYSDVLKDLYTTGETYSFLVFGEGIDQLTKEFYYIVVDENGFRHRVYTKWDSSLREGQSISATVLEVSDHLRLEMASKSSSSSSAFFLTGIDFTQIDPASDGTLRDYQIESKRKIYEGWMKDRSIMFQMPTGTGKTRLFVSIVRDIVDYGKEHGMDYKVLILAHRRELIDQISVHLGKKYGLPHGLIMAQSIEQKGYNLQVGSVPTLTRRLGRWEGTRFDIIIIDEAHHVKAKSYRNILDMYPEAKILGVTATPYRLNGAGFYPEFEKLIVSSPVSTFIKLKYLSEYEYYSIKPDSQLQRKIDNMKLNFEGDYQDSEMMEVIDRDHIRASILDTYQKFAKDKKTIVYTINQAHSKHLAAKFSEAGIVSAAIDSNTPALKRASIVDQFKEGKIQVLFNVNIFSEGFDCPDVEAIQLARPTKSLSLYLQQVGRGLRPAEGKEKVIILDNVGLYNKFGFPSAKRQWLRYFQGKKDIDESPYAHRGELDDNRVVYEIAEGDEEVLAIHSSIDEKYDFTKDFRDYLSKKKFSKHGIDRIVKDLREVVDVFIRKIVSDTHDSVLFYSDLEYLKDCRQKLNENVEFVAYNAKKQRLPINAINRYIEFVTSTNIVVLPKEAIVEEHKDSHWSTIQGLMANSSDSIAFSAQLSTLAELIHLLQKNSFPVPQESIAKYREYRQLYLLDFKNRLIADSIIRELKSTGLYGVSTFWYNVKKQSLSIDFKENSSVPNKDPQEINRIITMMNSQGISIPDYLVSIKQKLEDQENMKIAASRFEGWLKKFINTPVVNNIAIEMIAYSPNGGISVSIDDMDPMLSLLAEAVTDAGNNSEESSDVIAYQIDLSFLDDLVFYSNLKEKYDDFDIVGIHYHYPDKSNHTIVGTISPEPSNVHDSRAQVVVRSDGQKVGYIPRAQQSRYEAFNKRNVICPFVGTIKVNSRGDMVALITAILPVDKERVRKAIEDKLKRIRPF